MRTFVHPENAFRIFGGHHSFIEYKWLNHPTKWYIIKSSTINKNLFNVIWVIEISYHVQNLCHFENEKKTHEIGPFSVRIHVTSIKYKCSLLYLINSHHFMENEEMCLPSNSWEECFIHAKNKLSFCRIRPAWEATWGYFIQINHTLWIYLS